MATSRAPFLAALALWVAASPSLGQAPGTALDARPAPAFPGAAERWIGAPASWPALRGRVVLLNVWTFGCVNCRRTLPWLKEAQARYGPRGLAFVGVHTPELDFERERSRVEAFVAEQGLHWPHLIDGDYRYWRALENRYWPAVYLADRCGRLRARFVGEIHSGQPTGRRAEAEIERLLAEDACRMPGQPPPS